MGTRDDEYDYLFKGEVRLFRLAVGLTARGSADRLTEPNSCFVPPQALSGFPGGFGAHAACDAASTQRRGGGSLSAEEY